MALHYNAISFSLFICLGTRIQNLLNLYSIHHVPCPPSHVFLRIHLHYAFYHAIFALYKFTLARYRFMLQLHKVLYTCAALFIVAHYHVVFLDMSVQ